MATERRTWAAERTWAIKGVSDRTREAVLQDLLHWPKMPQYMVDAEVI